MLVVLALGLSVAARPLERLALLAALVWLAVRAPVGPALGLQPLFSPATFFRPLLGPALGLAGVLALAGILLTVGGVWLWRQRLPRRWYGLALGGALLLVSPYLISSLGRGITPPADGVSIGLWLSWQLALWSPRPRSSCRPPRCSAGTRRNAGGWWHIAAGRRIALAASVIGVLVWSPRGGWPDWYTFLWTPALLLVTLPGPRWAAITGIALVAGSSSALVTWGAELAGRVQVAQRDVARLGNEPDPLAVPLLERFGEQLRRGPRRPRAPRRCTPSGTARRSARRAIRRTSRSGRRGRAGGRAGARLARSAAVAALDDGAWPAPRRHRSGCRRCFGCRACTTC